MTSHNAEGMKEEEMRQLRRKERAPQGRFKKRHLKDLSEEEVDEIISMSKQPGWLQRDIAQKFCVPRKLVGILCKEAEVRPEKRAARRQQKQLLEEKLDAIEDITNDILKSGQPIVRAQQVQEAVADKRGMEVSDKLVRQTFRKELSMGYRLAKDIPVQSNLERNLVLR